MPRNSGDLTLSHGACPDPAGGPRQRDGPAGRSARDPRRSHGLTVELFTGLDALHHVLGWKVRTLLRGLWFAQITDLSDHCPPEPNDQSRSSRPGCGGDLAALAAAPWAGQVAGSSPCAAGVTRGLGNGRGGHGRGPPGGTAATCRRARTPRGRHQPATCVRCVPPRFAIAIVAVSIPVMRANSAAEPRVVHALNPPPAAISWLVTSVFSIRAIGVYQRLLPMVMTMASSPSVLWPRERRSVRW